LNSETWPDIFRFGETVCGSLRCDTVQKRVLPEYVRMTGADSGGIYLFGKSGKPTLVSFLGVSTELLYDLLDRNTFRKECPFRSRSVTMRFPVHDGMLFRNRREHRQSTVGGLLGDYGFDHCMYAPLIYRGRLIGNVSVARAEDKPPFTTGDLRVAERLARFAQIGMTNAARHEAICAPNEPDERNSMVDTVRFAEGAKATISVTALPEVSAQMRELLTERELEVFGQLALGLTNAEIGSELGIALNTVKQHVRHVYEKLGARTRVEAVQIGATLVKGGGLATT
jgi:DNA-binding CsgD family transcriptional regulator